MLFLYVHWFEFHTGLGKGRENTAIGFEPNLVIMHYAQHGQLLQSLTVGQDHN